MEDVACRVPVDELMIKESGRGAAAAAIDRAFEELVSKLDHPTLIPEVSPEARKAAATVRAICAEREIAALAGVEFRLRVVFLDEEESEPESDSEEEAGSDLEFDDECWELGQIDCDGGALVYHGQFTSDAAGEWRYEHGEADLSEDEHDGGQFTARPFDGALTREGGPSDGTLLLSGFEASADGPDELGDQQHELTPRDVRRLVRLAFSGGDVEGDEAYQRALAAGGGPVSPATLAAMLDRALRSVTQRPPAPSGSGMPPGRMRTGW
ncbi:hypothetical protein HU200_023429 [Digitaria exilis]|uniref:Uncharacterized protein n=1 Tax=Digitaria exilis TaxID=1010633 RepID=A0A835EUF9_9POAL|nr:hypothetical protein HU200_023429 [Digitaria exilis]